MEERIRFTGRNEAEALVRAQRALGLSPEEMEFTVVERRPGLLGRLLGGVTIEVKGKAQKFAGVGKTPAMPVVAPAAVAPAAAPTAPVKPAPAAPVKPAPAAPVKPAPAAAASKPMPVTVDGDRAEQTRVVAQELLTRMGYKTSVKVIDKRDLVILKLGSEARELVDDFENSEALQMILNKIVNRFPPRKRIVLESGDRSREGERDAADLRLSEQAREWIRQVRETGKELWLPDLNPRERRLVHMEVSKDDRVESKSEGEGRERRMCILPAQG